MLESSRWLSICRTSYLVEPFLLPTMPANVLRVGDSLRPALVTQGQLITWKAEAVQGPAGASQSDQGRTSKGLDDHRVKVDFVVGGSLAVELENVDDKVQQGQSAHRQSRSRVLSSRRAR